MSARKQHRPQFLQVNRMHTGWNRNARALVSLMLPFQNLRAATLSTPAVSPARAPLLRAAAQAETSQRCPYDNVQFWELPFGRVVSSPLSTSAGENHAD